MMIKIATFFLIGMAVLAMFGRLRIPKIKLDRNNVLPRPKRCENCGRINVTGGDCSSCDNKADGE